MMKCKYCGGNLTLEQAKIKCAEKLFEKLSNGEVHYGQVKDYKSLMDIVLDR